MPQCWLSQAATVAPGGARGFPLLKDYAIDASGGRGPSGFGGLVGSRPTLNILSPLSKTDQPRDNFERETGAGNAKCPM